MGFNPSPSLGIGDKSLKGLELNKIKSKKPTIKIFWIINVNTLNSLGWLLVKTKNKKEKIVRIITHNNKLPSWFPHVPAIL